jgi:hypothetical protein
MNSGYARRRFEQVEDYSDDEGNPLNFPDPNTYTDRTPLTHAIPLTRQTPHYPSSLRPTQTPYTERPGSRPGSRYVPEMTYQPTTQSSGQSFGAFVPFPDPAGHIAVSSAISITDDWIARQQPLQASQADSSPYKTRNVRLSHGKVLSTDYP